MRSSSNSHDPTRAAGDAPHRLGEKLFINDDISTTFIGVLTEISNDIPESFDWTISEAWLMSLTTSQRIAGIFLHNTAPTIEPACPLQTQAPSRSDSVPPGLKLSLQHGLHHPSAL